MFWRRPKSEPGAGLSRQEALACVPVKRPGVEESRVGDGLVLLAYPMPISPWVVRTARLLGRAAATHQIKKTELDQLGSAVWGLIDGRRSVGRISKMFAGEHKLLNREAEVAVTRFIRELGRRGIIGLQ